MGDEERVCCMCGDVGFPDKLFQCSRCCFRLQHSYCSNYYYGNESSSSSSSTFCDWCLSEGRNTSSTTNNTNNTRHIIKIKSPSMDNNHDNQRIKQHDHHNQHQTANNGPSHGERASNSVARNSGIPSPRTGTHRRYKLLKDVMC
ncbi:hypothetical protein RND81_03G197800 [Saponaria officinalis]|uniref:PHD-type zinc finger plants domain-containing protein n=1 Tax=Saponaria officinalis TaxID=3572 RepID=A0AAW1MBX3_SAPOF